MDVDVWALLVQWCLSLPFPQCYSRTLCGDVTVLSIEVAAGHAGSAASAAEELCLYCIITNLHLTGDGPRCLAAAMLDSVALEQ